MNTTFRPRTVFLGFVVYGVLLIPFTAMASGMGEGSTIPASWVGSPLSAVSIWDSIAIFELPAVWLILGLLIATRHERIAGAWLFLHYFFGPLAVRQHSLGWEYEHDRLLATNPLGPISLMVFYVVGQIAAWKLILRRKVTV